MLADAALVLRSVALRQRGATRWIAVADLVAISGLTGYQVESAIAFLVGRGWLIANETPAASVKLTLDGARTARFGDGLVE